MWVGAAALYTSPLREAIHRLKYAGQRELAAPLARYLVAVYRLPPWPSVAPTLDAVVPVPLHPTRQAERGYNQAALLAHAFAESVGLPVVESWLERVQATRSQVGLSARERHRNVAQAFQAAPTVYGHTVLLVDDLFTTGATLMASARALLAVGARAVYGLALATPTLAPVEGEEGSPGVDGGSHV